MTIESNLAYAFDQDTRAYMGNVKLQPSPDGRWHRPEFTVGVTPAISAGAYQTLRLTDDGSRWEIVDDFRNHMLWSTRTSEVVPNHLVLGEKLPPDATLSKPHPLPVGASYFNVWNAQNQQWDLVPDFSNRPLWNKADGTLAKPVNRGVSMPQGVTDRAPPTDRAAPIKYEDSSASWQSAAVPEIPSQS